MLLPLFGRTALVTGVSRRAGIGYAVALRLAALGANVFIHHHRPHDLAQPWGGDDLDAVRSGIEDALAPGARMGDLPADLRDASAIPALMEAASALSGGVDILICNQAMSGFDGGILDMSSDRLDAHWQTNARSTLLLTAEFARRKSRDIGGQEQGDPLAPGARIASPRPFGEPTGHVIWMTSGQGQGPMRGEVAYAASKAALAGVTATVAAELLDVGIVLNTVNPGPVNTGYLDPGSSDRDVSGLEGWLASLAFGRLGRPDDPARLISWLCTDAGSWVVGQVLTSDGGISLA